MSALAAARLYFQKKIRAAGVYLYAAARAGNSALVSTFPPQIPVVRYEHYLDVVPFLPPNVNHPKVIAQIPPLDEIFKHVMTGTTRPSVLCNISNGMATAVGESAGLSLKIEY